MKWKRTKKGSKEGKDHQVNDDEEHKLEIDESDTEDNMNIQVDSPNPDIEEPQSPPQFEIKTENPDSHPFYLPPKPQNFFQIPEPPSEFLSPMKSQFSGLPQLGPCPPFSNQPFLLKPKEFRGQFPVGHPLHNGTSGSLNGGTDVER